MAPLIKVVIQGLPFTFSSPGFPIQDSLSKHQSSRINVDHQPCAQPSSLYSQAQATAQTTTSDSNTLSTISWGSNRVDVFGLTGSNLTHKYWDGFRWGPNTVDLETLGNGLATPPAAVTWGIDRLDIFGLDDHNVIKHQYWDGSAWRPDVYEFENLGGVGDSKSPISVTTWGESRLDVFATGPDGDLLHQYYDGSQWQPDINSLESLGGELITGPSAISWGKGRLDIFAVEHTGKVAHIYYDGTKWSDWETFSDGPLFRNSLFTSSWGENRLDIYGVADDDHLYHKYWDGSRWADWEDLGGALQGTVGATSWLKNRIDIVGYGLDNTYYYKFYDGQSWQPDVLGWYPKRGNFKSSPSVSSWGNNRLDIFGVGAEDDQLTHQTWYGSGWYPGSTTWEVLGGPLALSHSNSRSSKVQSPAESELRK